MSPYENILLSGRETHVMLFAAAKEGKEAEVQAALTALHEESTLADFAKQHITNFSSYSTQLQGSTYFMLYFDYAGDPYLGAAEAFESVEQTQSLSPFLNPHPRATQSGNAWLQMEWINYIYGMKPRMEQPEKIVQVTRVREEHEDHYRTLHQTVWPGVVDHMARIGNHDFSIFFVELGDELYQFYYVESYATEAEKAKFKDFSDPVYDRWMKVTSPCLNPLPGAVDCWVRIEQVSE